jgi:hypothetical protein
MYSTVRLVAVRTVYVLVVSRVEYGSSQRREKIRTSEASHIHIPGIGTTTRTQYQGPISNY